MKKILLFLFSACAMTISAQVSHKIEAFSQLDLSTGITVKLIPSDHYEVVVSGEDTQNIFVKSAKGKLTIRRQTTKALNGKHSEALVYFVDPISHISASSGAKLESDKVLKQQKIEIGTGSGASVELYLEAENVSVSVSTGGQVKLNGSTGSLTVAIASGGQFEGFDLIAQKADLSVTAGGTIRAQVEKELKANISMGGYIYYKGDASVQSKTSMGGRIQQAK